MMDRTNREAERNLVETRRRFAWGRVKYWDQETAKRIQSVPVQLRAQGLSTMVAVLLRENRIPSQNVLDLIVSWLLDRSSLRVFEPQGREGRNGPSDGQDLLDYCMSLETERQSDYYCAQADALALLCEAKLLASARYPSEVQGGS